MKACFGGGGSVGGLYVCSLMISRCEKRFHDEKTLFLIENEDILEVEGQNSPRLLLGGVLQGAP